MSKDATFVVRLTDEERFEPRSKTGPRWTNERAAEFAELSTRTTERVRRRFVEEGFDSAVYDPLRP